MGWTALQGVPGMVFDTNGNPYTGAVLKAWLPGTTTTTDLATDGSGTSPQATITANADGIWEVSGNEVVPHIDRKCKWGIFANSSDASANGPFYMGPFDNIEQSGTNRAFNANATFEQKISNLQVSSYAGIRGLTSSQLTDGDNITLTGDKIAGSFTVKTGTVTDNAGTLIVFTDDSNRYAERTHDIGFYSAFWWCVADGTTDDAANIAAADAAATAAGRSLFFPKAEYGISVQASQAGVSPTCSWMSYGATLKNTNLALASGQFMVLYDSQDGLTFDGFVLDGQITVTGSSTPNEDQATPSDSNIDDYTKCAGFTMRTCTNMTIRNCIAKNFWRASFRGEIRCKNILIENCKSERNRGEFGDPFFFTLCRDVKTINCSCYDFTRIGIVYDGVSASSNAGDFSVIQNFYAEYAHDNISSENNAAVWLENSENITITSSYAVNTVGGFVLSATSSNGDAIPNSGFLSNVKGYNLDNCHGIGLKFGVLINPDGAPDSVYNISNCNMSLAGTLTFNGTAATSTGHTCFGINKTGQVNFVVNIDNCNGYIDNATFDAATSYSFCGILEPTEITGKNNVVNITNGNVKFSDAAKVRTDALLGNGKGFVASYGSCSTEINLNNCADQSDSLGRLPISLTSYDNRIKFTATNCNPQFIKSSGDAAEIHLNNCPRVDCEVSTRADIVRSNNCGLQKVNFDTSDAKINGGSVVQWVQIDDTPLTNPTGRAVILHATGVCAIGNLATESTFFFNTISTDRTLFKFDGCEFFNNDGATNDFWFIQSVNATNGEYIGSGNIIDNRVTTYANLFTNGTAIPKTNPKTDTDADMPFGIFFNIAA